MALAKRGRTRTSRSAGTTLETKREFVDNCFLLDQVFRGLMAEADCRAITIHGCMATIMPKAQTSACLTLSTLNDDGYLAFCESDFVVIPSGMLLANITRQARVPQRPDLSARRRHHAGPLHGPAEDGRQDARSRRGS